MVINEENVTNVLFAILSDGYFQELHFAILGFRGGRPTAHITDF